MITYIKDVIWWILLRLWSTQMIKSLDQNHVISSKNFYLKFSNCKIQHVEINEILLFIKAASELIWKSKIKKISEDI